MDEDVFVELLPTLEESNLKELVATQLNSRVAPLIRYRTGDLAHRMTSGCPCGRGLGVIDELQGRAHDLIVTTKGHYVHGQFFTHLIVFEPGIEKYQVIQIDLNSFKILLLTRQNYSRETEVRIAAGMKAYLGEEIQIEFQYPGTIPLTASGKHRWIVSMIGTNARSPQQIDSQ
jgi:phenylacetate-CoA ligase